MRNISLHDGNSGFSPYRLPNGLQSEASADMPNRESLSLYQRHRQHAIERLIARFAVQLQHGCGNSACTTPTCYSYKSRSLSQPARKLTCISARAMAVLLVASDYAEGCLCPYISESQLTSPLLETLEKIDRKSIIQKLFNTQALVNLEMITQQSRFGGFDLTEPIPGDPSRQVKVRPKQRSHSPLAASELFSAPDKISEEPSCLTCTEMICLEETPVSFHERQIDSLYLSDWIDGNEKHSHYRPSADRIFSELSDFKKLAESFTDQPLNIFGNSPQKRMPTVRLDEAFRGWSSAEQTLIFNSIWMALEPFFESPFVPLDQYPARFVSLPPSEGFLPTVHVSMCALHALTASVPQASEETWHIILSTVVNGKAHGKQRNRPSDIRSSPWVHILDALEFEPGLRMANRLVRAIAARTCLEETLSACGVNDRTDDLTMKTWSSPEKSTLKSSIIKLLIEEERRVREAKFGDSTRDETLHGKALSGTTSMVWLEWLRKCFLKDWSGSFHFSRWGVAGAALEMIEEMWHNRDIANLDIPDDLFPLPTVFNHLDVDKVALDWKDFKSDRNTRHILSFQFVFRTRGLTLFFRTVNHIIMRKAYSDGEAALQMRRRMMPHMSFADCGYLDRRLRSAQEHYLVLKINRHSVLSDALDQLWHREKGELFKPLRIRMGVEEGEIGHDLGGVQIEFFKLACQEMFNPDYSLFSVDPQTHLAWFQPASLVPLYKYHLLGLLFALAIFNGVTLPVSFPLAFYRKLLFKSCGPFHLREGWPGLAKSLKDLLEYSGSVEQDFARDYVFGFNANGLMVDVDMQDPWDGWSIATKIASGRNLGLGRMKIVRSHADKHHPETSRNHRVDKETESDHQPPSVSCAASSDEELYKWPGWSVELAGSTETPVPVDNENRFRYVEDYTDWLLDYSIRPQFMYFAKGFYAMMNAKALSLLTPETLRSIVEGQNTLNIDLLERAATYQGYDAKSPVIRWFWEVVKGYPQEKQKQLLEFVTASNRVPVNGAESLMFVIEKLNGETTSLPGSQTCFGTLRLPEYESKEVLRQKLDIALEHSIGFGQA